MRLVVVIATRNRPQHVIDLLSALADQEHVPEAVVVVDSSDASQAPASGLGTGSGLNVRHKTLERASLPHQRNVGAEIAIAAGAEVICFLDDDVRPRPDYLRRLADLLERDTVGVVGGVSGTSGWTQAVLKTTHTLYNRLFLLAGRADGRILRSGYNMPVDAVDPGVHSAQWLFGCSMWRADVLRQYRFHDNLPGSALFEDVEFSLRVGKEYLLLVDTSAHLDHLLEMEGRPDMRLHYERIARNRAEVVRAMGGGVLRWLAFWWSVTGDAARLLRHVHSSGDYRYRLRGLVRGAMATALRRVPR